MTSSLMIVGLGCIFIGFLLSYLRRKLVNVIVKKYPTTQETVEPFQAKKFLKGFVLTDPVLWTKSIFEILDIRKLIIYVLIACAIMGYGYYKGWQNRPIKVDVAYGKEVIMKLNGEQLHIDKQGNVFVEDSKTGKVLKQISVKDISNLKAQLAPFGFQLKPIIVAGASMGSYGEGGMEIGAGFSFFRYWKMQAEAFITTHPAVYLGTSYNITDNAGIGIAVGKSLSDMEDTRIIIYGRINF